MNRAVVNQSLVVHWKFFAWIRVAAVAVVAAVAIVANVGSLWSRRQWQLIQCDNQLRLKTPCSLIVRYGSYCSRFSAVIQPIQYASSKSEVFHCGAEYYGTFDSVSVLLEVALREVCFLSPFRLCICQLREPGDHNCFIGALVWRHVAGVFSII